MKELIVPFSIVCIGAAKPPLNMQFFLGNPQSPLKYWFFLPPTLKIWFFSEPQEYFNVSPLTSFYLLKVTKFLVKISQFEFLAMKKKNIFVYYLFVINYFKF